MDLRGTWFRLGCTGSEQGPIVEFCGLDNNLQIPKKTGNFFTSSVTIAFSRKILYYEVT
jgi:hypothetical protein